MISHPTVRATILLLALIPIGGQAVAQAPAAAADPAVIGELIELNKRAIIDHKSGRHQAADQALREALALAEKSGLGGHDMAARTHVHLGIVAIAGLGQRDEGLRHFARARALKPDIKLTKQLATPELTRHFEDARRVNPASLAMTTAKAKEAPPPPTAKAPAPATPAAPTASKPDAEDEPVAEGATDVEPDVPVNVPQPLYCPTPMEGPPQAEVRLHCLTQTDVTARKVVLYYRPGDGDGYTAVPMNRTKKGWFSAVIPAQKVTGRALQFYFEAQGDAGRVAAANGKGELPNVLVLKDGAPPVGVGALAALSFDSGEPEKNLDEDTPLELREKEEQAAVLDARDARRGPGRLWVGLGVGSGYGWHRRRPLENHPKRQVSPGFSPLGRAHATPELGLQLTRRFAVSLQTRHQYLPPSGSGDPEVSGSPPTSAHAIMVRAHYAAVELGRWQLIGTGSLGYGSAVRMKIDPAPGRGLVSSDTVVAGPLVAGPGAAIAFHVTSSLLFTFEARSLVGLPRLGALLEGTGGVQYAF